MLSVPCIAQPEWSHLSLTTWIPQDEELWGRGYALRGALNYQKIYIPLALGGASPKLKAFKLEHVQKMEEIDFLPFMGMGVGYKFIQWDTGKSFIGGGVTLYILPTGERMEGYHWVEVYPDGRTRDLGPAYEHLWILAPEIMGQFQLFNIGDTSIGIEICATLGSHLQPPIKGTFLGLTMVSRWD